MVIRGERSEGIEPPPGSSSSLKYLLTGPLPLVPAPFPKLIGVRAAKNVTLLLFFYYYYLRLFKAGCKPLVFSSSSLDGFVALLPPPCPVPAPRWC